jgi:hypothetical protein
MITTKLVQLVTLSSVAILLSFSATTANAMSLDSHGNIAARHAHISHELVAKKKRGTGRRCKNRSAAFPPKSKTSSSKASKPTAKSGSSGSGSNGNSGNSGSGSVSHPSYGGAKMCLAWPNGEDENLSKFKTDKVGPIYTWSPFIPSKAKKLGFKPVPMLWSGKQIDDFERLVVKGYADTILGFNEPNQSGQAEMAPSEAARIWKAHIEPKRALGYRTISPATTNAPSGKKWLQDFLKACNGGCTLDAVAVHYYHTSAEGLIEYLEDHHKTFGKNIWLTEFACQNFSGGAQCTKDEVFNFMSKVTKFMDNAPWVEAYCPFGVMHDMVNVNPLNQLMKGNGDPTDLGWAYLT